MSFPGQSLQRAWHLVDAKNQTVGRLAGQISQILRGKHKPTFRPNKDMGDHVVVINAEKVSENVIASFLIVFHVATSQVSKATVLLFQIFLLRWYPNIAYFWKHNNHNNK